MPSLKSGFFAQHSDIIFCACCGIFCWISIRSPSFSLWRPLTCSCSDSNINFFLTRLLLACSRFLCRRSAMAWSDMPPDPEGLPRPPHMRYGPGAPTWPCACVSWPLPAVPHCACVMETAPPGAVCGTAPILPPTRIPTPTGSATVLISGCCFCGRATWPPTIEKPSLPEIPAPLTGAATAAGAGTAGWLLLMFSVLGFFTMGPEECWVWERTAAPPDIFDSVPACHAVLIPRPVGREVGACVSACCACIPAIADACCCWCARVAATAAPVCAPIEKFKGLSGSSTSVVR